MKGWATKYFLKILHNICQGGPQSVFSKILYDLLGWATKYFSKILHNIWQGGRQSIFSKILYDTLKGESYKQYLLFLFNDFFALSFQLFI